MSSALMEDPVERSKTYWEKQQNIHGKDIVPDELLDVRQPDGTLNSEQTLLEAAADVLAAPRHYCVAGRRFQLQEPTIGQIKRLLLPAAGKIAQKANAAGKVRATDEDLVALVQGTDEFQELMLDCITFTDGQPRPESMVDWMDSLPAGDGLDLVDAFVDGINWMDITRKAKALWGKIKGVTTAAPRPRG